MSPSHRARAFDGGGSTTGARCPYSEITAVWAWEYASQSAGKHIWMSNLPEIRRVGRTYYSLGRFRIPIYSFLIMIMRPDMRMMVPRMAMRVMRSPRKMAAMSIVKKG